MNLNERSINNWPLPRFFWVVLDIPTYENDRTEKLLTDLGKGELNGLRGISDNKQILTNWFGVARNAAIFMNPEQISDQVDIERIPYEDPDALCANNLKILFRVFDKEKGGKYAAEGVMLNIVQYMEKYLKATEYNLAYQISYYGPSRIAELWRENPTGINSANDLTNWMMEAFKKQKYASDAYDPANIKEAVWNALKYIGRTYEDEGEWIIQSSALHIPPKSIMLVGVDTNAMEKYDEWKKDVESETNLGKWWGNDSGLKGYDKLITNIKTHGIDKYYTIKFVDVRKWEEMRSKLWDRRKKSK